MTISAILGATTSGSTGSIYQQVWEHVGGLDYTNTCKSNFNFFVKDRMPAWIINDNPKFVKFIEIFYDWLGCENDMAIIETLKDVDITPDEFVKLFKETFAKGFPDQTFGRQLTNLSVEQIKGEELEGREILVDFLNPSDGKVDVRNFLRHIKQLYQMKSIEEVYEYFFRVFYDGWVDISYPKELVIRCSEAPFRGASANSTGVPCDYWAQQHPGGGATGDCWCREDGSHTLPSPCWNPGGRTAGTPYCDCPPGCAPGSPCGVYYDDEYGTISGLSRTQDSKVWQDYSYLIDSNIDWEVYWPFVQKLIHPSGLYAAGNYNIWDEFAQPGVTGDIFEIENPITGFYAPYRFETETNLRNNSEDVDLYPCGWLPYLGGSGYGGGYGVCGASYSSGHIQDSGGLWYRSESGITAHQPRLAGIPHGTHGFTAAPLGLTGHTGGTAATNLSLSFFHIYNHPNSWSNEVSVGTKMKDVELGQFIFLSPINTVTGSPNNPSGSTASCGF